MWAIGLQADDPEAQDPSRGRGKKTLENTLSAVRDTLGASEAGLAHPASSRQFRTPTTPDVIHKISPAPPRPLVVARACLRSFLRAFDLFFLTRQLIRVWLSHRLAVASRLSHLVSTPLSRYQNTASAPSGAPLLSATPILLPNSRFPAELAFLHLLVVWRFFTLVSQRLSLGGMFMIACSRYVRHPLRANRNAPLVLGGSLANRPLRKLRRVFT